LMIVLVIGLLMVEDDETPQGLLVSAGAPPSVVEAPVTEPAATLVAAAIPPEAAAPPAAAPSEGSASALAVAAEPGAMVQPEPLQASELAQPPSSANATIVSEGAPAAEAVVRKQSTPPGPGYMLQLGVFGDPSNADSLRDELDGVGFPAHVQSRVVIGPYADRKAAQAAHDKLRQERKLEGMIIPPRKP
jgi:DedD protein